MYVPSVGSGFDALAGQNQFYTGLNASILRGNADAVQQANEQRNAYIFNQQQAQREAMAQQAAARNAAIQNAIDNRQRQQQIDLQVNRYAAQDKYNQDRLAEKTKTDQQNATDRASQIATTTSQDAARNRFNEATQELQDGTFDPKNYADLPADQLGMLSRGLDAQRQPVQKSYFDAVQAAKNLNFKQAVDAALDPKNPVSTNPNPDFLAGLKATQTALAKSIPDPKAQQLLGITYDADSRKYVPPPAPSWLSGASASYKPAAPSNAPLPPASVPPPATPLTGVTSSGIKYRIVSPPPAPVTSTVPSVPPAPAPTPSVSVSQTPIQQPPAAAPAFLNRTPVSAPAVAPPVSSVNRTRQIQGEDAEMKSNADNIQFLQTQLQQASKSQPLLVPAYQKTLAALQARQQWLATVPHVGTPPPPVSRNWLGHFSI